MIVEIATWIVLAAGTQACAAGESVFSRDSHKGNKAITVCGSIEPSMLYSQSVEYALADDLKAVAEINCIFVERVEGNLLVWITANHPSKEVRERIFQKQFDLIDAFHEVSFDFNIVSTGAQDPREIHSAAKLIYAR
jgi:hypothetical protein